MKKLLIALFCLAAIAPMQKGNAQSAINAAEFSPSDHSSMIKFKTLDGTTENAFYIPSDSSTGNVLIIFHEQWGLTNDVVKEAEKWKAELGNVDVYAIDMYAGKVTSDPDIAVKYLKALDDKRSENIIKGLLSRIGADKRIVTLGWGEGGRWAFKGALLAKEQTVGCVMYYGVPEKEEKNVRGLHADVLYNWASHDKYIQRPFVDDFGRNVEGTKHKFELHVYDAEPAFADPSNPKHNAVLTAEADKYTLSFIKSKFQIE